MSFTKTLWATMAGLLCAAQPAATQDQFPTRPITIIVPISTGTTIDILARLYADKLAQPLGQRLVVSNRPGAGGIIAGQAAASAPADGSRCCS